MKLSSETTALLKTLSKLQSGLIIQPGNTIKVRTAATFALATVVETFPTEIRICNIQDFLHAAALFKDPEFDFTAEHIRIAEADGTAEVVYPQAQPGSPVCLPFPNKMKPIPPENVTFAVRAEQWASLRKALGNKDRWQRRNLTITSDGISVRLIAKRGGNLVEYSITVATPTTGLKFKSVLDSAHLLMPAGPYQITVTPTYAMFQHNGGYDLRYFVGVEIASSTWGDKKTYLVAATKSMVHDCQFSVLAHSPEEAEAIVRQKPDEECRWTAAPRIRTEFKVVD